MILYFTGTGNSRYIAKKLAEVTNETLICINDKIKAKDTDTILVKDRLVFVVPTYAWRIPKVVEEWILKTEFLGARKAWFVMNCGDSIGNAAKYNKELCDEKLLSYKGTAEIVMPENYIAMFEAPEHEESLKIIKKAEAVIENVANLLMEKQQISEKKIDFKDKLKSGPINPFFYKFCVKADPFTVKDNCITCGKCEKLCPLNNISIKNGRPMWGKSCTHCMACICNCPTESIEYGKKSVGKVRYICKE